MALLLADRADSRGRRGTRHPLGCAADAVPASRSWARRRDIRSVLAIALLSVVLLAGACSTSTAQPPAASAVAGTEPTPTGAIVPSTTVPLPPPVPTIAGVVLEQEVTSGSGLKRVSRDCGFTVPLSASVALWLFCDTVWSGSAGHTLSSTAAVSGRGGSAQVYEALDRRPGVVAPFPLLPLTPADEAANEATHRANGAKAPRLALWPTGAVTLDDGTVLLSFRQVRTNGDEVQILDTGLAHLVPGATAPPAPGPIQVVRDATSMVDHPWPALGDGSGPLSVGSFGPGLVRDGDWVYTYGCTRGCRVARAKAADLQASLSSAPWTYLGAGNQWVDTLDEAVPIPLPGSPDAPKPEKSQLSIAMFPSIGWVMTYSAGGGAGHTMVLRFSNGPAGPWSEATTVNVPTCGHARANGCYAYALHPEIPSRDGFTISFFRQPDTADSARGIGGQMWLADLAVHR